MADRYLTVALQVGAVQQRQHALRNTVDHGEKLAWYEFVPAGAPALR